MTKQLRITVGIIYFIFMGIMLWGVFSKPEINILKILIGSIGLIIPWIICIVNASKNKMGGLWIWFLIFFGGIAIPIYIFTNKDN